MQTRRSIVSLTTAVCLQVACSGTEPDGESDGVTLRALPLAEASITCIHALGELTPPGELLGSIGTRWDVRETGACGAAMPYTGGPVPVQALAAGTIVLMGPATVTISINEDLEYWYRGVVLDGFLAIGTRVPAGSRLGVIANPDSGLTVGVTDFTRVNDWLAPARYPDAYRYARDPVPMFTASHRAFIATRSGGDAPLPGRLVWDATGTLAGNWFAEGTPQTAQAVTASWWEGHLAFHGTAAWRRVGVGTALDPAGGCRCAVMPGALAFEAVTPTSGPAVFTLHRVDDDGSIASAVHGTLLVEMTAADRLRAEFFAGAVVSPAFGAAALTFLR